jgi:ATP-dependent DNA ligase
VVRNGRDWSAEFVAITEAMRALPFKRVMLDGEAVAHCLDGLTFTACSAMVRRPRACTPSTYSGSKRRTCAGSS